MSTATIDGPERLADALCNACNAAGFRVARSDMESTCAALSAPALAAEESHRDFRVHVNVDQLFPSQRSADAFVTALSAEFRFVGASGGNTGETKSRVSVHRPPGSRLRLLAHTVFGSRATERIFDNVLADMQREYFEALANNRPWQAFFARVRGYLAFAEASVMHMKLGALAKAVEQIRKLI